jgi:hypothetical protein
VIDPDTGEYHPGSNEGQLKVFFIMIGVLVTMLILTVIYILFSKSLR